ncbi:class I SAM-dependent methyltransferase [Alkalicoccus daliensis]|uniref:Methyltransferase type 11 domain-containing protein n=1 Tax=Alkalicoccus daliensis TaxID=745820 RepID=A0A1H0GJH7_9BACI|nr:methyltransferase domain-containing protein [Alkalicoccus daliensis]SDO06980.1 hypothetical protein SAMN04488053_106132 [Alkalicoccus daliensis]
MAARVQVDQDYWKKRSNLMYYQYVDYIVRGVGAEAQSLLDVGSSNAAYTENFAWIPERFAIDISKPYASKNIQSIEADFLLYEIPKKFDLVLCLQVLEHIEDARTFAEKLFQAGDRVLISVPFLWEAGSSKEHVQDPVSFEKLRSWTGRDPDYHIVVEEPISNAPKNKRLICYYHPEEEVFSLVKIRRAAEALTNQLQRFH